MQGRVRRVGAEHAFELARHLTERDREVALCLYEQQVLTTDQLALLFFSSKRRAQDRLLFLYRERVLDRFYPAAPFGAGKAQAHWLLDEAGALLVAAVSAWTESGSAGSAGRTGARIPSSCTGWNSTASSLTSSWPRFPTRRSE